MLNKLTRSAILCLSAKGHSLRKVATLLSVSTTTVMRIVLSGRDEPPKIQRSCKAAPHRQLILKLLSEFAGNLLKVHAALADSGIDLPYSTLTRFCRHEYLVDRKSDSTHSPSTIDQFLSEILSGNCSIERLNLDLKDLGSLLSYLKHGNARQRRMAATIIAKKRGFSNSAIAKVLHMGEGTTKRYLRTYARKGAEYLLAGKSARKSRTESRDIVRTKRLLELLHHKPHFYGINRTSWHQPSLFEAYKHSFGENISRSTLTRLLRNAGYKWKKARKVLSSPDPCYHEKVELLLKTLQSLSEREMFFFLDEWGPVQVKKRGGSTYRYKWNKDVIPRQQTHRGTVSLVGALSATSNQMTWQYVASKDSQAMMDLLEMLYNQFISKTKIYVTWDAVAWHNSSLLLELLDRFNVQTRNGKIGPIIELVPLPTSAQFLNVIEGVFSGMVKAVINNSDYQSPLEMKKAISKHFNNRNAHFRINPKRAGKKIWDIDFFQNFDCLRSGDYRDW